MTLLPGYKQQLNAQLINLLKNEDAEQIPIIDLTFNNVRDLIKSPENLKELDKLKLLDTIINSSITDLLLDKFSNNEGVDQRMDYSKMRKLIEEGITLRGEEIGLNENHIDEIINDQFLDEIFKKMDGNAISIVMVLKSSCITPFDEDHFFVKAEVLKTKALRGQYRICSDAPFSDQLSAHCLGSGFFIASNVIVTAAHLLFPNEGLSRDFRFINNCSIDTMAKIVTHAEETGFLVRRENVFKPVHKEVRPLNYDYTETNQDWAVLEVEADREGAIISVADLETEKVNSTQKTYCIGHGLGLPTKISYGGRVMKIKNNNSFFECELSAFAGNSGSPIFDSKTHKTIGVLVRGTPQLEYNKDRKCFIPRKEESLYEGEECQVLEPILKAFNEMKSLSTI